MADHPRDRNTWDFIQLWGEDLRMYPQRGSFAPRFRFPSRILLIAGRDLRACALSRLAPLLILEGFIIRRGSRV